MNVEEIMTRNPVSVTPKTSIRKVMEIMFGEDIRHIPVVDGSRITGIISDRDLRSFSLPSYEESPDAMAQQLDEPVSTLMRGGVYYIESDGDLDALIELMIENKVGAIPVVATGTEELVGIVSYIDVLRAARDALAG